MTDALARQRPFWEPGTKFGYHAVTFGWLLGELIRRIDGRTLRQFVAEEIAGPFAIDFTIGCDPRDFGRCADALYPRGLSGTRPPGSHPAFDDPNSLSIRATYVLINPPVNAPLNSAEWRAAEFGAMNGTSNARAIAKFYSVLAAGGSADGVSVFDPRR
jgi:CubicO group peptidase (beta-lactamase class C family)